MTVLLRTLALLLLLVLLLPLLTACGKGPELEDLMPTLRALLDDATLLNDVMLGDGAPRGELAFSGYYFVDDTWVAETGIGSVAELKEACRRVYTDEVCEILFRKALTTDSETLADYRDRALDGGLLILAEREGWYSGTQCTYLTEEAELLESKPGSCRIRIPVRVEKEGEQPILRTLTLPLVRGEGGAWRADKLTLVSYDTEN